MRTARRRCQAVVTCGLVPHNGRKQALLIDELLWTDTRLMHTSFLVAAPELWYYHDWDKQFLLYIVFCPRFQKFLYMIKIPKRAHFGLEFQNVIKIFLEIKSSGFSSTTPLQIKVLWSYSVKIYAYEFETSVQLQPYLAYTRLWISRRCDAHELSYINATSLKLSKYVY